MNKRSRTQRKRLFNAAMTLIGENGFFSVINHSNGDGVTLVFTRSARAKCAKYKRNINVKITKAVLAQIIASRSHKGVAAPDVLARLLAKSCGL